jgi:hypothetical protein
VVAPTTTISDPCARGPVATAMGVSISTVGVSSGAATAIAEIYPRVQPTTRMSRAVVRPFGCGAVNCARMRYAATKTVFEPAWSRRDAPAPAHTRRGAVPHHLRRMSDRCARTPRAARSRRQGGRGAEDPGIGISVLAEYIRSARAETGTPVRGRISPCRNAAGGYGLAPFVATWPISSISSSASSQIRRVPPSRPGVGDAPLQLGHVSHLLRGQTSLSRPRRGATVRGDGRDDLTPKRRH